MSIATEPATTTDVGLTVRPLQPTIGAEIGGIDLREPLTDARRDEIKSILLQYKVVFFRDQQLDRQDHEIFAARFGPLYLHPSSRRADDVSPIHQIAAPDQMLHERKAAASGQKVYDGWDGHHTDTSWRLDPTWGAVLRAVTVPEIGGDTIWVDAGLAYEGLSDEVQDRLAGLHVAHDFLAALTCAGHDYPVVAHPIVRLHRETGKPILWVNFTQRPSIIGLDQAEGKELLTLIIDQYRKPEHQVRFNWRPGSVAFWDNRAAVHYAVRNYGDFPRLLERVLIADQPLYRDL
jgi:alpha-ketoglutarate-dependent sulfate ester dioxygenase